MNTTKVHAISSTQSFMKDICHIHETPPIIPKELNFNVQKPFSSPKCSSCRSLIVIRKKKYGTDELVPIT